MKRIMILFYVCFNVTYAQDLEKPIVFKEITFSIEEKVINIEKLNNSINEIAFKIESIQGTSKNDSFYGITAPTLQLYYNPYQRNSVRESIIKYKYSDSLLRINKIV